MQEPEHIATYAIVGELVMIANAIDHLLNRVLIAALSLELSPMLEPVVATLDPRQKIEILKGRAKHIKSPDWKSGIMAFCDKAEAVYRQRNIVCHTPAHLVGDKWKFTPIAAAKLLKKIDLEKMAAEDFPFNEVKTVIRTGEAALGVGVNLLENLGRFNAERVRREALKRQH